MIAALLPMLLQLLQSKKQQPQQAGYDRTPPAPGGSNPDDPNDEIGKSRKAILSMEQPKDEPIGADLTDSAKTGMNEDQWNLLGGGGGGY